MNIGEAKNVLLHHGNIPGPHAGDRPATDSLAYQLSAMRRGRDRGDSSLDELVDEVVSALEVMNRELNGDRPSETRWSDKRQTVDRLVVYAISAMQFEGLRAARVLQQKGDERAHLVIDLVLKVSSAWEDCMAGDIDAVGG